MILKIQNKPICYPTESLVVEQGYGIAACAIWKDRSNCVRFHRQFASKHKEALSTQIVGEI